MANPTTNAHAVVSICALKQNADLTAITAAALAWIPIGNVGSLGAHGKSSNMISYGTLDRDTVLKAKGQTDLGDPTIECAEDNEDLGQLALNSAADTTDNYAVQIIYANGDTRYWRGPIGGPEYSGGGNEDFRTATYTMGCNQILNVPAP